RWARTETAVGLHHGAALLDQGITGVSAPHLAAGDVPALQVDQFLRVAVVPRPVCERRAEPVGLDVDVPAYAVLDEGVRRADVERTLPAALRPLVATVVGGREYQVGRFVYLMMPILKLLRF